MVVKVFNLIYRIKKRVYIKYFINNFQEVGPNVRFYGKELPIIKGVQNISVGKNVFFNEFCYLYARNDAEIHIGDGTTISSFSKLVTSSYDLKLFIAEKKNNKDIHVDKSIIIGQNCWIGMGAIILPGVELNGKNIIVAAGAVVTKNFEENNIVIAGNPASIIKHL